MYDSPKLQIIIANLSLKLWTQYFVTAQQFVLVWLVTKHSADRCRILEVLCFRLVNLHLLCFPSVTKRHWTIMSITQFLPSRHHTEAYLSSPLLCYNFVPKVSEMFSLSGINCVQWCYRVPTFFHTFIPTTYYSRWLHWWAGCNHWNHLLLCWGGWSEILPACGPPWHMAGNHWVFRLRTHSAFQISN